MKLRCSLALVGIVVLAACNGPTEPSGVPEAFVFDSLEASLATSEQRLVAILDVIERQPADSSLFEPERYRCGETHEEADFAIVMPRLTFQHIDDHAEELGAMFEEWGYVDRGFETDGSGATTSATWDADATESYARVKMIASPVGMEIRVSSGCSPNDSAFDVRAKYGEWIDRTPAWIPTGDAVDE